jgi:multiple sugar transport system substrate-binding protein
MRRRTTAHRTTVIAALCLLALGPVACTGGGGGHPPRPTTSGGGEIVVASGLDVTGTDGVRQQLIQQWNSTSDGKEHPARLVELPGSADQQRSQLLGALQSGSSAYDVVNLDVTWVPEFARAGLISPLDRELHLADGDVIPSVATTAQWKGRTYAVPFNSDVGLLYYRIDTLKAVGVNQASYPHGGTTAWSQLQSVIRNVDQAPARDRPAAYRAGWTSQLDAYEGLTVNAVEAFASAGVRLTDDNGHYAADPGTLRKGLNQLKGRADSTYTLTGALTSREAQSLSDFAAGRTVFLRHWPYAYGVLSRTLGASRFVVARLPGRAVLGGQDLAVTAGSPRAKWALKLIAYLTKPEAERCLLDAGFAATRKSAYTDPKVRCRLTGGVSGPSASAESHDMPRDAAGRPEYAARILLPALTTAVQRPRTPYYGAFTQLLQSRLHDWLTDPNLTDPDQLADSLDRSLAKILRGK